MKSQQHHSEAPIEALRRFETRQLVPGVERAEGSRPGVDALPKGLGSGFWFRMPETWSAIGRVTIGEMLGWSGVGERKVRIFLEWLDVVWGPGSMPPRGTDEEIDSDQLLGALADLAGWGASRGHGDLVTTIAAAWTGSADTPLNALDILASVDLSVLAGTERLAGWDPVAAANRLLEELDERQLQIARSRIFMPSRRPMQTLEELGIEFGVVRERVRQLERVAEQRINSLLSEDRFRAIRKRASEIAFRLGTASPISELPEDVAPDESHLADELLLWVAGPYRLEDGWAILRSAPDVTTLVDEAFESVADGHRVDRVALELACMELGVPEEHVAAAIATSEIHEWSGDWLVRWPREHGDRAVALLELIEVPMSIEEMIEEIPFDINTRGFTNAVQAHASISRVGKDRYGLTSWGGEEYRGIVPEMQRLLEDGAPHHIGRMAADLRERFGVSEVSVSMYANMYPAFVAEEGWVRLRAEREPYRPRGSVTADKDCFLIDGAWALRVPVDRDVLRGSGRTVPEAFAGHIGLDPFTNTTLLSDVGPVSFYWSGMQPSVGSLRTHAEQLRLDEGDLIFLRYNGESEMDVVGIRMDGTEVASEARLRALVGDTSSGPWPLVIARALGEGGEAIVSVPHLRRTLEDRGNAELVGVLDAMAIE